MFVVTGFAGISTELKLCLSVKSVVLSVNNEYHLQIIFSIYRYHPDDNEYCNEEDNYSRIDKGSYLLYC